MQWAELIKVITENGLGIASFIALLLFIFNYQAKANEVLNEMSKTLVKLVDRIENIEDKLGIKEKEKEK